MFTNLPGELPFYEVKSGLVRGLATSHLEVDFLAPSFIGDELTAALSVREIGKSSIGLEIVLQDPDGSGRVRGRVVLVLMDALTLRAITINDDIRGRISADKGRSI